jgi:hypothetical protein
VAFSAGGDGGRKSPELLASTAARAEAYVWLTSPKNRTHCLSAISAYFKLEAIPALTHGRATVWVADNSVGSLLHADAHPHDLQGVPHDHDQENNLCGLRSDDRWRARLLAGEGSKHNLRLQLHNVLWISVAWNGERLHRDKRYARSAGPPNFVDWNITITVAGTSVDLLGPLSGNNSTVGCCSSTTPVTVTATATTLAFAFGSVNTGGLFDFGLNAGGSRLCFSDVLTVGCGPIPSSPSGITWQVANGTLSTGINPSLDNIIADRPDEKGRGDLVVADVVDHHPAGVGVAHDDHAHESGAGDLIAVDVVDLCRIMSLVPRLEKLPKPATCQSSPTAPMKAARAHRGRAV